jgi:hypothetical protein
MMNLTRNILRSLFATIIAMGFLSSCTERIDINVGTTYTRLAVEGYITPEEGRQWVKLTKTADYFSNEMPVGVSGANVTIEDGEQTINLVEDQFIQGLYKAPDDFVGKEGIQYNLQIDLEEDIAGYGNFVAQETMPYSPEKIDSIALEYIPQFEVWLVKLYALEPPTEDFYMFNGYVNGIIVTDSVSRKSISDDRLFNGSYTSGAVVMVVRETELKEGDIFTLELSNITKSYADYMTQLQTELQPNDPLFSGPPANVSSNISNDAVGYFACYPSLFASAIAKIPDR